MSELSAYEAQSLLDRLVSDAGRVGPDVAVMAIALAACNGSRAAAAVGLAKLAKKARSSADKSREPFPEGTEIH